MLQEELSHCHIYPHIQKYFWLKWDSWFIINTLKKVGEKGLHFLIVKLLSFLIDVNFAEMFSDSWQDVIVGGRWKQGKLCQFTVGGICPGISLPQSCSLLKSCLSNLFRIAEINKILVGISYYLGAELGWSEIGAGGADGLVIVESVGVSVTVDWWHGWHSVHVTGTAHTAAPWWHLTEVVTAHAAQLTKIIIY